MANMNKNRSINNAPKKDTNTTLNHEGAVVHQLNALEELFARTTGSFMGESTFYEKRTPEEDFERVKELIASISQEDAEYVLKIAAIGRESNMISYPLAVLTACYNDDKYKGENFVDADGKNKLAVYSDHIIRRGRDITDILSNQIVMYGFETDGKRRSMPLPKQERKNLKRKLEEFDEYQISKALGKSRAVSMADAVKLLRPANKNEFFRQVIENNVSFGNGKKQVQSELAKLNNTNTETTKKDVQMSIADSSLLAIIKNLASLQRNGALDAETTKIICDKLTNPEIVKKSMVLPFQIYNAYKMFPRSRGAESVAIRSALEKALDFSIYNVDTIEGYNAIFVDLSGSMDGTVSMYSSTTVKEMACLLAAICLKVTNARVYAFATTCKEVEVSSNSSIVDIMAKIMSTSVGGSTLLVPALQAVKNSGEKFDNVIVLSDGDAYTYDERNKKLTLGARSWGWRNDSEENKCDTIVNDMIAKKFMKRFFINNLDASNFTVVNTDDYRKNLVTGFSEKYIDEINFTILLEREAGDVRNIINILYDKYYKKSSRKSSKKRR